MNYIENLKNGNINLNEPVLLFDDGEEQIYWVGSSENFIFRCNAYLVRMPGVNVLIDPGGIQHFDQVRKRVSEVINPSEVTHIVSHHQDPDVAGSIPLWLKENPELTVVTTPRTKVLLPYYGFDRNGVKWLDVSTMDDTILKGNKKGFGIQFLSAPFLHFPDAFASYDIRSGFLFSGDIFAAIQQEWELVVTDWERHKIEMMYFHIYYMASNKATRYFANKLRPYRIEAIIPQHGSIIPKEFVPNAIEFLEELKCGIDLLEGTNYLDILD
ncbi:MBL fold metallo-hydrolase [Desulfurobacterium sp.]|uniref:MBL fold metallo-hydrolase n=1 Tax=Desulfurobacterium sp. TaxID=2004706 RepID=UPI002634B229|nr:MBL fold metallo-hydrolase [Desulfurobacterium sp.]